MVNDTPKLLDVHRIDACAAELNWISQVTIVDQTKSTNADLLRAAAGGSQGGCVLVAENQTSGRGRRGRQWLTTPYEDLALSILIRPSISPDKYPTLSFWVGMAIYDALVGYCEDELRLKWPNDLLLGSKKVAGMLAESVPPMAGAPGTVVIGVGINLNSTGSVLDDEVRATSTSIARHTKKEVDRTLVLENILRSLDRYRNSMNQGKVDPETWNERAAWIGEEIVVTEDGQRKRGTFLGVHTDGSLRLREANGFEQKIICGDVVRRA